MATARINLADPDFEPTDDQLRALARAAFADVSQQNAEAVARVAAEIEERRREVTRRLQRMLETPPSR